MTRHLVLYRLGFPWRFARDVVFFAVHPAHGNPGDTYWQAWWKYRIDLRTCVWLAWSLNRR